MDLVDLHCHGALGHEFGSDGEGSRAAAAHHRAAGVGSLVGSLVSGTPDALVSQVATLAPLVASGELAGIHLEGPFLSQERRGAHDPSVLTDPDLALIETLVETCTEAGVPNALVQWTFAPERAGSEALVEALARHGILPAVGHTDASADVVTATLASIADACGRPPLVTHLFNGMPAFHHRAGGPAAAALAAAGRGDCIVELIADGVHLGPEVVRMVFETVGAERIALVSDAMAATGLGDGAYTIGTLDVEVASGVARLADGGSGRGSIAGSTSTLGDCVRWCIDVVGLPEADVLTAASTTPRTVLSG
ncbi:N-acetylglucosamine-6-phosphate deacetylase [Knoellia subterranea]|uniref:N-acetylglucosamine-6-phosphate deacetylase n=1 Tax=Knoellia subterranea TaxID=184882 RepID=UPI000A814634|nr:N-acetylglucosamine-6-phosphate deacetylase [Knoellia subterranea]